MILYNGKWAELAQMNIVPDIKKMDKKDNPGWGNEIEHDIQMIHTNTG